MNKASHTIAHWVTEHVTHWLVGGMILVATGFAPEEWISHLAQALNVQDEVHKLWPGYLDLRAVFVAVGVVIVVGDRVRHYHSGRPLLPTAPESSVIDSTLPQRPGALAEPETTNSDGDDKGPGIFEKAMTAAGTSGTSAQADRLCADIEKIVSNHGSREDALRFIRRYIQEQIDDTEEWLSSTLRSIEEEKKKSKDTDGAILASAFSGSFYAREMSDAKRKKRALEAMHSELDRLTEDGATTDISDHLSKVAQLYK